MGAFDPGERQAGYGTYRREPGTFVGAFRLNKLIA